MNLDREFQTEEQFQAASIMMISQEFPRLRDKVWHTKNEQYMPKCPGESEVEYKRRCAREGNKQKGLGLLAGVMDILAMKNGILYKCELKLPDGRLHEAQKKIHMVWNRDCPQIPVIICYTLSQVYQWAKIVDESKLKIQFNEESFYPSDFHRLAV